MAEIIVKYNGDIISAAASVGFEAELLGDNYAILDGQEQQIDQLYTLKEVEYIELPKTVSLVLQESMHSVCTSTVHNNVRNLGLSGAGVIIGIIDSGIDYTHPDFRNSDNTSRILYMWDQNVDINPPAGYKNGTEYTKTQIDELLHSGQLSLPSLDTVGHGTAVAGIAAGNGQTRLGNEAGVAPQASLIIVKLGRRGLARSTDVMRALKYVTDRATELGMPVAINLSYGTNNGSHAGNSLFETYTNAVSQRWKTVIAVATGNEGFAGHHFGAQINNGQIINASFIVSEDVNSIHLTLWKKFVDDFDIELVSPTGATTGRLNPTVPIKNTRLGNTQTLIYYNQPSFYNGNQEIFFGLTNVSGYVTHGLWQLKITGRQILDGNFNIWLPTVEEVGLGIAFTAPDPIFTLTLPSTALNVISVAGYNATLNSIADFSGQGYNIGHGVVKPDVAAPAVNILAPKMGGGYDTFTGTSFAAPFVTGAAALIMEWGIVRGNDPFLYGQRIKAFLQKTAAKPMNMSYPNPFWGYGTLCLDAALDLLEEYNNGNS